MTPEIGLTLGILGVAVIFFITEALRVDLVALLMLAALAITGLVTPEEALSGFSSPAVVTVWAVFILSSGLSRTGVANWVGRQVLRIAGKGEARLLIVIMLTAGVLSAFMNNVGVAAMMLPVVLDIARRTGRSPSKLLMPLAFGCLLGGMTTLMGTPPNILVSDILAEYNLRPFGLFDYAPVGLVAMVVGIIYMVLIGRHMLPAHDVTRDLHHNGAENPAETFDLEERLFVIHLPDDSPLAGKTLGESRLGAALSITVVGIMRAGETRLAPHPEERLQARDRLLVTGRPDRLIELTEHPNLTIENQALDVRNLSIEDLTSTEVELAEITIAPGSRLIGQTLAQIDLRVQYGFNVLAIQRDGVSKRTNLQDYPLLAGDVLLIQVCRGQLDDFETSSDFLLSRTKATEIFYIDERLMVIGIPRESSLA
ncbi:MAG: anion permease, partial [Anaerolineales bacterium]|nr:anion permease [Anaerolineales bacterium]